MRTVRRTLDDLVPAAREGDPAALGRLLTLVERAGPDLADVLGLFPTTPRGAHVLGITGPPGAGKSTLVARLVGGLRADGRRVAVLAVDPSSQRSGGALLGDRVRMQEHDLDDGVLVRSLASRGLLGGLSAAVPLAVRVVEAVGFDVVLVETVGVGQSEIDVVALTDTTVVVLAPGMGDGIQASKAGLLEVGDVFVANKADREGAGELRRDLHGMLRSTPSTAAGWEPPVLATVAATGEGTAGVVSAAYRHRCWLDATGERHRRVVQRVTREILSTADAERRRRWSAQTSDAERAEILAERVAVGELSVPEAAVALLS